MEYEEKIDVNGLIDVVPDEIGTLNT